MEVAPRYKLPLSVSVSVNTVYTFYNVYSIQTALHCLNSSIEHFWERLFPLSCIHGKVIGPIVYNESLMMCSLANCSLCLLLPFEFHNNI